MGFVINFAGAANANGKFGGIIPPDTTPNAFSFTAVSNALLEHVYEASDTIDGLGEGVLSPISIAGGEYKIGAGAFTSADGNIGNGQVVTVRLTSSASANTSASCTLTVGGVSAVFTVTTAASATLVYFQDFSSGVVPPNVYATGNSTASIVDGALKLSYPADALGPSGGLPAIEVDLSALNLNEIYIEYDVCMPNAKWGFKNLKVFGKITTTNTLNDTYSNCTLGAYYSSAEINAFSYGDGTTLSNDTQCTASLVSPQTSLGPRNGSAVVSTPENSTFDVDDWGSTWHHFRIKIKFNSGTSAETEVPDGEYILEIDDKVYVHATGLYNRSWQSETIDRFELGGWTQGENPAFDVLYDNIVVSEGGFTS